MSEQKRVRKALFNCHVSTHHQVSADHSISRSIWKVGVQVRKSEIEEDGVGRGNPHNVGIWGRVGWIERTSLTPTAKYKVKMIDPKYIAVNGRRGPEIRCLA